MRPRLPCSPSPPTRSTKAGLQSGYAAELSSIETETRIGAPTPRSSVPLSVTRDGRSSGTVTVLFTDLVGSTDLMTRLGDLVYDQLRGEHSTRLRGAVVACDGVGV